MSRARCLPSQKHLLVPQAKGRKCQTWCLTAGPLVMGIISVSPTWSNTKLHGIQVNHIDSHKTPDSKYYLPSIRQMFVAKATISSNWLMLCCINFKASLCFLMNDKCLKEASVNWQPPPSSMQITSKFHQHMQIKTHLYGWQMSR